MPSANKPPFLAFASDDKDIDAIKAFASAHQWPDNCVMRGDISTAAEFLKSHASPALLLVDLPSATEAPALLDALANVCDPDTKVITTGTVNEYSFYCWLMDIGIFSYLLRPLTPQTLESAWQKSVEIKQAASKEKQPAKIFAVMGTRGGVGASTVAANIAGIIGELAQKKVALVDLHPQEGSIALMMDIEPSRGLREALERPERIDFLFIERVMHTVNKHLSVLSAEEALHDPIGISPHAADALFKELREQFDVVILDLPRYLTPFIRASLKEAEEVVLVSELTLLSLRDVLRIGDMLRDGMKMPAPMIVANRVGAMPKQETPLADFEKGINGKVLSRIGYAPEVFANISNEIPALKHKANPVMKPLYALAEALVPEAKAEAVKAKKSLFSRKKKSDEDEEA